MAAQTTPIQMDIPTALIPLGTIIALHSFVLLVSFGLLVLAGGLCAAAKEQKTI